MAEIKAFRLGRGGHLSPVDFKEQIKRTLERLRVGQADAETRGQQSKHKQLEQTCYS